MINTTMVTGANLLQLLTQNVADPEKRGCTLVRTLVKLVGAPAAPGATEGIMRVSFGIAMASDDAFVGGALPDVQTADDFPVGGWLWREPMFINDMVANASNMGVMAELKVDLRSQRKLDRVSLYLHGFNELVQGTGFLVRVMGLIRCLYKLP